MNEFKKLGLSDTTISALSKKGYKVPTPIQAKTIPILLKGDHDIIGQAQTGTGKTACFALPIIENLKKSSSVQALILVPTRELAVQVTNEIKSLKGESNLRVTTIYGGASIENQISALGRGVDIVVGTPGRVIDLINRKMLDITNVSYVVLDEADEMLNMGFVDDIEEILSKTKKDKKMLLFSATIPRGIIKIAKRFMREYEMITIKNESLATELIEQIYYDVRPGDRFSAIKRIIAVTSDFHGIIFCKTKIEVDALSQKLSESKYESAGLHGDISQGQRESILKKFKEKKISLLIATDVAARGIDVNDLNVVINYSLPQSPEMYVHRIGRTGRAGNKGLAITFLIPSERTRLKFVERMIKDKITKAELPSIQKIIETKKLQIESSVVKMIESYKGKDYNDIANNLLANNDAQKVVAAVLSLAFTGELNSNNYKDIVHLSSREDNKKEGKWGNKKQSFGKFRTRSKKWNNERNNRKFNNKR